MSFPYRGGLKATRQFYLRDATTSVGGTLPAATQSASAANVTATGANTNRTLGTLPGAAQTSAALTTLAQTTLQKNFFRRFVSASLVAQTIPVASAQNPWQLTIGVSESNTNSNMLITMVVYVWRPTDGTLVGRFFDKASAGANFASSTEVSTTFTFTSGSTAVTATAGDILCVEIWAQNTQSMGTAYTNTVFYEGTTNNSATNNAAYILAGATGLVMQADNTIGPAVAVSQTVKRSAFYMSSLGRKWKRNRSGILTPEYV